METHKHNTTFTRPAAGRVVRAYAGETHVAVDRADWETHGFEVGETLLLYGFPRKGSGSDVVSGRVVGPQLVHVEQRYGAIGRPVWLRRSSRVRGASKSSRGDR